MAKEGRFWDRPFTRPGLYALQLGGLLCTILLYRVLADWPWIVVLPLAFIGQAVQLVVSLKRFEERRRTRLTRARRYP